jgi:DNA-binding transcriptional LysR family regulator
VWPTIELREIRLFLALADELHFGRAAARLELTPSRVSQVLRELEAKVGGELLSRTSRRAALTELGERFRAEVTAPYEELSAALERTAAINERLDGSIRIGLLAANSAGPHFNAIVTAFERLHPECEVRVSEIFFDDPLGPLRRGEIDGMATRLPLEQPDLVVGVILAREPRVLAVASEHPLADRERISIEDVADYPVAPITDSPREMVDATFPRTTPSGRRIRRLTRRPKTPHELIALVARGRIVQPTVPSFAEFFGQPNIKYIPIADLPAAESGLVWRRRDRNPRLREFARVARKVLAEASEAPRRRQPSRARSPAPTVRRAAPSRARAPRDPPGAHG